MSFNEKMSVENEQLEMGFVSQPSWQEVTASLLVWWPSCHILTNAWKMDGAGCESTGFTGGSCRWFVSLWWKMDKRCGFTERNLPSLASFHVLSRAAEKYGHKITIHNVHVQFWSTSRGSCEGLAKFLIFVYLGCLSIVRLLHEEFLSSALLGL